MRFFFSAFLLVFAGILSATTPYKTYSVGDGMPNSTIKAICQDTLGYIWLGTRDGLVRFDGYEFRTYYYKTETEDAVSSNDITCFTLDRHGRIWIGTFNWITLFDPAKGQFTELPFEYSEGIIPQGIVTNIWIAPDHRVWVGSKTGLYTIEGDTVRAAKPLLGAYINCMEAIDSEHLLVEIMNKSTALYHIPTGQLTYVDERAVGQRPMIYHIHRDRQGRVWCGADSNHLYEYLPESNSLHLLAIGLPGGLQFNNDQIHDILEYNDSTLILGTDNGMLAIDRDRLTYTPHITSGLATNTLTGQRIMCLFQDEQDALWVGTFGKGVKYVQPNRYNFCFHEISMNNGLPVGVVGELVEKDGKLWIGHEQGLSVLKLATGRITSVAFRPQLNAEGRKTEVFSLYQNPSDSLLYVYLLNNGLYAFDTEAGQIVKRIGLPPASQVRSMETDWRGELWIAEEELSVYDPQAGDLKNFLYTNINNISNFMLTQDLLLRSNGNMLVGTRTSGVWEYPYDETNRSRYSVAHQIGGQELGNKNINVLFEDSQNNLWIGTYGSGLFVYDRTGKAISRYDTSNGLTSNSVCDIVEDESTGNMWVATINGISKVNPDGHIANYTSQTGFPLEEVSRKAFLKASDGLFYVGGSNGLASFDPKLFTENPVSPNVVVSLVRPLNQSKGALQYRFDNAASLRCIEIPFRYSSLQIKFSSLNYFFPHGTTYHYLLEGVDEDWITTTTNEAIYTQLHEGKYTFKIKASDNEGHWSDHITEVQITILPPIWRTTMAKILYVLLISLVAYILFKSFYDRKTAKYKQQIAQMEKDNLKRYYQMKLDLFTKFSHELRTPLMLIQGPIEEVMETNDPSKMDMSSFKMVHNNLNRLRMLIDQLLTFRKKESGSLKINVSAGDFNGFAREIRLAFNELARIHDIDFRLEEGKIPTDIWYDRAMFERVLMNILSNAFKYTPDGGTIKMILDSAPAAYADRQQKVNVRFLDRTVSEYLRIRIEDSGPGIPEDSLDKVFEPFFQISDNKGGTGLGLTLSSEIVRLHHGAIWAENRSEGGAVFTILIPVGHAHFSESDIIHNYQDSENINRYYKENKDLSEAIKPAKECTILIVEDNRELREYIVGRLSAYFRTLQAADGREGLIAARTHMPSLIVSDIMMPVMDGLAMCREIKTDPHLCHIPVILLTARSLSIQMQEGLNLGADDYITKPFNINMLALKISNMLFSRENLKNLYAKDLTIRNMGIDIQSQDEKFLQKLNEVVAQKISDTDLDVGEFCSLLGMSRSSLYRKLQAATGLSPSKYLMKVRLHIASRMLKETGLAIQEIVDAVGFANAAHFSVSFKKQYGISPTQFRLQNSHTP